MADEEMIDVATPASGSTSDDESEGDPVELLVIGRERRKTAGNRYDRQMVQEEAEEADEEDEVALLFAGDQDEVDEEFRSEASDEDDMSSSDDDDQGPNAAADDMDGEKVLQKQEKAERAQKRKARDALTSTAALRKRARIDPTVMKTAPKKPSKKKERVTWVPDMTNTSGRNSLRKQTIAHRATTIARLKESEAQSKIYKRIREQREREKAKDAPKPLTQAERMAEAERTERRNAKSLNRWEAMEKKRNEEQAAKLAALKNRKLEGPVISWRSRGQHFRAPKYPQPLSPAPTPVEEGPKKRGRKPNSYHEQMARTREAALQNGPGGFNPIMEHQPFQQMPWVGGNAQSAAAGHPQPQGSYSTPAPMHSTPVVAMSPAATTAISDASQAPAAPNNAQPDVKMQPVQAEQQDENSLTAAESQPTASFPEKSATAIPSQQADVQAPNDESFLSGIFDYANMEGESRSNAGNHPGAQVVKHEVEVPSNENSSKADPVSVLTTGVEQNGTATESLPKARNEPPLAEGERQPTAATDIDSNAIPPGTVTVTQEQVPITNGFQSAEPSATWTTPKAPGPPVQMPLIQSLTDSSGNTIQVMPPAAVPAATPAPAPVEMVEGVMMKNFISLKDFEELSTTDKNDFGVFFNIKKMTRPTRHNTTICPITLQPARYRDPSTGIGYANMHAYKVLQELKQHKFAWSSMLGCYIGREGGSIARGCPEGFLPKPEAATASTL